MTNALSVAGSDERNEPVPALPEGVDLDALCELALGVLQGEGAGSGHLDLHLVDPGTMADLKAEHFGEHRPTDVLAFPLDAEADPDDPVLGDEPRLLGDVVICPAVARDQAPLHSGDFAAELRLLCVHGVLHILGHDHAESAETALMHERERRYLGTRP